MRLVGRRDPKAKLVSCLLFLFLCIFSLAFPAALKRYTRSFHLSRCTFALKPQIFSKLSPDELQKILSQPFHYLDRGAQSFVFSSEDGAYVIKLFIFDSSIGLLARCLGRMEWKAGEKAVRILESCKAASLASEETALVYLHLGPSEETFPPLRLIGPAWKRSSIHSADYCFALQMRAEPFKKSLQSDYLEKDRNSFSRKVDALYVLLNDRIARGIHNSDSDLFRNFGFINSDRAIEMDFGNYRIHQKWDQKAKEREIERYRSKLVQCVDETMPEWKDEIIR